MKKKNDISGHEEIKSCISYIFNKYGYKFNDNIKLLDSLLYDNIEKLNHNIENTFSYFGIEILFWSNDIASKELQQCDKLQYIAISKTGNYYIVDEIKNDNEIVLIRNNKKEIIDIANLNMYTIYLIKKINSERLNYLCNSNKIKNNIKEVVNYKKSYLLYVLLSIAFGVFIILISSFFQMVFDVIIPNKNNELLDFILIYYLIGIFVVILLKICQIATREIISTKIKNSISYKEHFALSLFKNRYKSTTIIFFEETSNIILIIVLGYIMHNINFQLFLVNVLSMLIYITTAWLFIDKLIIANKIKLGIYKKILYFISMLKSDDIESKIYNSNFNIFKKDSFEDKEKYTNVPIIYNLINKIFSITNISFIIILGVQIINNDSLSIGYFIMFLFINLNFIISLEKLVNKIQKFQESNLQNNFIQNMKNYYDVNYKLSKRNDELKAFNLEIRKMDYRYRNGENIFNNVNMKIQSGRKIAICGGISSGKTTLTKLLINNLIATNGEILINNVNINEVSKDLLDRNIYILEPKIKLGEEKIRDIICGDKKVDDIDLEHVCKQSGIKRYIDRLPNKLDTVYRKGLFSNGQISLLLFARALLEESQVLILDNFIDVLDLEHRLIILDSLSNYNGTIISMSYQNYDEKFFDDVYIIKNKLLIKEK